MFGALSGIEGLPASLVAAAISVAGIFAVAMFGQAAQRNGSYFAAFAVGILTVAVLFHLIPEALDISFNAVSWIFGGFAAMVIIGIAIQISVSRSAQGAALTFGYASIIGLAAHSFLDGIIYAAAFHGEPLAGWITVSGLMLHEFPEGIIAYFLLAQAGLSKFRSIILAFFAASLTTVLGTFAANLVITITSGPPMAAMFGGAAGALSYVLIVHLAPHAAQAPDKRGYFFAQLGVIVGVIAIVLNSFGGAH